MKFDMYDLCSPRRRFRRVFYLGGDRTFARKGVFCKNVYKSDLMGFWGEVLKIW
jgi:hypothetical protein